MINITIDSMAIEIIWTCEFSHYTWWFSIAMLDCQRVYGGSMWLQKRNPITLVVNPLAGKSKPEIVPVKMLKHSYHLLPGIVKGSNIPCPATNAQSNWSTLTNKSMTLWPFDFFVTNCSPPPARIFLWCDHYIHKSASSSLFINIDLENPSLIIPLQNKHLHIAMIIFSHLQIFSIFYPCW